MTEFHKESPAGRAHTGYLYNVWTVFLFLLGPVWVSNKHLFLSIWMGIRAIFGLICLLVMVILSPITCWVGGYLKLRKARKEFESFNATYVGKFAHLNRYKL